MADGAAYPPRLSMPVGEAMFSQRAIRRLKADPISDEDVKVILDAAAKAPSGGNQQPARFLVIKDRERIKAMGELYHEAWWAKRRDEGRPWKTREEIPVDDALNRSAALLADELGNAPLVVLVFALARNRAHSVFPPVQNLLLAARSLGIGGTLTTLHPQVMERVYALFSIPKEVEFHCCIPMGYPRGRFGPTQRLPTAETSFYDHWGTPPPWA